MSARAYARGLAILALASCLVPGAALAGSDGPRRDDSAPPPLHHRRPPPPHFPRSHHLVVPDLLFLGPPVVPAPVYVLPPPVVYAPPEPVPPPETQLVYIPPPRVEPPREVVLPTGRWELHGDGRTYPHVWVWVPSYRAALPAAAAPAPPPPSGPPAP